MSKRRPNRAQQFVAAMAIGVALMVFVGITFEVLSGIRDIDLSGLAK